LHQQDSNWGFLVFALIYIEGEDWSGSIQRVLFVREMYDSRRKF